MNRILVIRGGAIGDFVLTLPAIQLLRDRYPTARIELLANENIAALAENRFYADAIRSLESASLAKFFAKMQRFLPAGPITSPASISSSVISSIRTGSSKPT